MHKIRYYCTCAFTGIILISCAGTGEFTGSRAIKSLDKYESPLLRDIAQMLYPGFREMEEALDQQFPDRDVRFRKEGLEILEMSSGTPGIEQGYYAGLAITTPATFAVPYDFLEEAQRIGATYFPPILKLMSLDWNTVFSSSLDGIVLDIVWENDTTNRLRVIFDNQNIEAYLNARMTLQELVDKSWVEAWHGEESLGRIELNNLRPQSA